LKLILLRGPEREREEEEEEEEEEEGGGSCMTFLRVLRIA
jgi:hypothetical protein